jgi:hypothetical protein
MGNLDAKRDWGFAGDYVKAMWLMLQQEKADDFVIATGETHSVKELIQAAFSYVGLDWDKYVVVDRKLLRPAEVDFLVGDPTKAKKKLGWKREVSFKQLVEMMVDADIKLLKEQKRGSRAKIELGYLNIDETGRKYVNDVLSSIVSQPANTSDNWKSFSLRCTAAGTASCATAGRARFRSLWPLSKNGTVSETETKSSSRRLLS